MVEVSGGNNNGNHILAELAGDAALLAGQTLQIKHLPQGIGPIDSTKPADVVARLGAANGWLPVVALNGRQIESKLVMADGQVLEPTEANLLAAKGAQDAGLVGGMAQGLATAIGKIDALGGSTPQASDEPGRVLREWVEISVSKPEGKTEVYRRTIFDLRGLGTKQAKEALGSAILSGMFLQIEVAKVDRFELATRLADRLNSFHNDLDRDSKNLHLAARSGTHGASFDRFQHLRWIWKQNPTVYVDRVQVTARVQEAHLDGQGGMRVTQTFDIVENGVAPIPGSALNDRWQVLRQGVADTVAETASWFGPQIPGNAAMNTAIAIGSDGSVSANPPDSNGIVSVSIKLSTYFLDIFIRMAS